MGPLATLLIVPERVRTFGVGRLGPVGLVVVLVLIVVLAVYLNRRGRG